METQHEEIHTIIGNKFEIESDFYSTDRGRPIENCRKVLLRINKYVNRY